MGQRPQSLSVLLAPRAAAHAATQSQRHRLGQQDRHSPRSLASKFSCALGNRSRLDPVCSRRNNPETEVQSANKKGKERQRQESLEKPRLKPGGSCAHRPPPCWDQGPATLLPCTS